MRVERIDLAVLCGLFWACGVPEHSDVEAELVGGNSAIDGVDVYLGSEPAWADYSAVEFPVSNRKGSTVNVVYGPAVRGLRMAAAQPCQVVVEGNYSVTWRMDQEDLARVKSLLARIHDRTLYLVWKGTVFWSAQAPEGLAEGYLRNWEMDEPLARKLSSEMIRH